MASAVGKRVFTIAWDSTNRTTGGGGTKYDYTVSLNGAPWLAQATVPTAYRMYLSTLAFWQGKATPTTTVGLLTLKIQGMSTPCTATMFGTGGGGGGGNSPLFIVPLTSTQYVDQNGISRQPILVAAFDSANLHVTWTGDDSLPVTDILDHRIVLTLEPIYD